MSGETKRRARQFAGMVETLIDSGLLVVVDGEGEPNAHMTDTLHSMAQALWSMLIDEDVLSGVLGGDS